MLCPVPLLVVLAAISSHAQVTGAGERGVLLYEELRNLTERNVGSCFRYPSGNECVALCKRIGFRAGRCHRRECFCMGSHCMDNGPGIIPYPSSSPRPSGFPFYTRPTQWTVPQSSGAPGPSYTDWPSPPDVVNITPQPQCPHDVGAALCSMGCYYFCSPTSGYGSGSGSGSRSNSGSGFGSGAGGEPNAPRRA